MKNKPGGKCASCSSPIVATLCKPMPTFFTAAFTVLMALQVGHAHREDSIDETLVFETLEKGELEPDIALAKQSAIRWMSPYRGK